MNTRQACDQWFDINRAAFEPLMRWNEIALQTAEKIGNNRQAYEQMFEISRSAMHPFLRWNEIAYSAAERVMRCNLSIAHDYLELGSRQMQIMCAVNDPQKWKDEQGKLVSEFGQKIVDHTGDYLKVARETQDAMTEWANQTARETADRAAKAAETAVRATSESAGKAAGSGQQQPPQPGAHAGREPARA